MRLLWERIVLIAFEELRRRCILEVCRVCVRGQYHDPIRRRCSIPTLYDADVQECKSSHQMYPLPLVGLHENTIPDGHRLGGNTYSRRFAFTCCGPIHFLQIRTTDSRRKPFRSMHGESGDCSTTSAKCSPRYRI